MHRQRDRRVGHRPRVTDRHQATNATVVGERAQGGDVRDDRHDARRQRLEHAQARPLPPARLQQEVGIRQKHSQATRLRVVMKDYTPSQDRHGTHQSREPATERIRAAEHMQARRGHRLREQGERGQCRQRILDRVQPPDEETRRVAGQRSIRNPWSPKARNARGGLDHDPDLFLLQARREPGLRLRRVREEHACHPVKRGALQAAGQRIEGRLAAVEVRDDGYAAASGGTCEEPHVHVHVQPKDMDDVRPTPEHAPHEPERGLVVGWPEPRREPPQQARRGPTRPPGGHEAVLDARPARRRVPIGEMKRPHVKAETRELGS